MIGTIFNIFSELNRDDINRDFCKKSSYVTHSLETRCQSKCQNQIYQNNTSNCSLKPGDSGGPLFNSTGNLVGVSSIHTIVSNPLTEEEWQISGWSQLTESHLKWIHDIRNGEKWYQRIPESLDSSDESLDSSQD